MSKEVTNTKNFNFQDKKEEGKDVHFAITCDDRAHIYKLYRVLLFAVPCYVYNMPLHNQKFFLLRLKFLQAQFN